MKLDMQIGTTSLHIQPFYFLVAAAAASLPRFYCNIGIESIMSGEKSIKPTKPELKRSNQFPWFIDLKKKKSEDAQRQK